MLYKNVFIELLRNDGSIVINKKLTHNIGLNETIIYSELLSKYNYCSQKYELIDDWFWYTIEDMENNTTLTKRQQNPAIKNLINFGLIEQKNLGRDNKRHFRINLDIELLEKYLGNTENSGKEQNVTTGRKEQNVTSGRNKMLPPVVTKCSNQKKQSQTLDSLRVESKNGTSSFISLNNTTNNTNNKQQQHISSYVSDKNTQTVENNVKAVVVEDSKIENISQNKEISGGKDKKELIKKEVDEANCDDIQEIIGKFKEKYKGNLDESLTKKLILRKGKDKVLKCIDEMEQYVNNADKVERVFYDFVVNCDTNKYTKGTQYNSPGQKFAQGNKPIQATNYEQREYSDEFFDSLYLNLDEYYPDKNSLD
jgi:hypothetical protein